MGEQYMEELVKEVVNELNGIKLHTQKGIKIKGDIKRMQFRYTGKDDCVGVSWGRKKV